MAKINDKDKQAKLDEVLKKLQKKYGSESVMELGSNEIAMNRISTGGFGLDYVLGGGFPTGRIIEIFGKQSSGKSVLSLYFIAKCQRDGLKCAFVDAERAFSSDFAKTIGVDISKLILGTPDTGEEGLEMVEDLISSGAVDVIVVDSVAALTPERELEGDITKNDVGLQSKMLAKFFRRVNASISNNNVILIMLNQLRDIIGAGGFGFGPTTQTPGGHSLKFYSSIRLSVSRLNKIKKGTEIVGNEIRVTADKNKTAPPFRTCDMSIIYSRGIDQEDELVEWGEKYKIVKKNGNTYTYKKETLGVGKDKVKLLLQVDTELANKIRKDIEKAIAESTENGETTKEQSSEED